MCQICWWQLGGVAFRGAAEGDFTTLDAMVPSRTLTASKDELANLQQRGVDGGVDAKTITTARPPDVELLGVSVAQALAARRPFVVTFASPLLCRKRACGPVLDVVRSVARRWRGRGVDFNYVRNGYNQWVRAWCLPSDPFTYVVDRAGVIRTKLEGAFSPGELDAAVRAVAPARQPPGRSLLTETLRSTRRVGSSGLSGRRARSQPGFRSDRRSVRLRGGSHLRPRSRNSRPRRTPQDG